MQLSLYASPHFQTCGILKVMTSESARVNDFSPHVIFAVNTLRAGVRYIYSYCEIGLKPAVVSCLTNALAPPPIARGSCSRAQTDWPVF